MLRTEGTSHRPVANFFFPESSACHGIGWTHSYGNVSYESGKVRATVFTFSYTYPRAAQRKRWVHQSLVLQGEWNGKETRVSVEGMWKQYRAIKNLLPFFCLLACRIAWIFETLIAWVLSKTQETSNDNQTLIMWLFEKNDGCSKNKRTIKCIFVVIRAGWNLFFHETDLWRPRVFILVLLVQFLYFMCMCVLVTTW